MRISTSGRSLSASKRLMNDGAGSDLVELHPVFRRQFDSGDFTKCPVKTVVVDGTGIDERSVDVENDQLWKLLHDTLQSRIFSGSIALARHHSA